VWWISTVSKEFVLVEKDFLILTCDNESIVLVRAEPLDLTTLFGQWPSLQETSHALYWHDHLGTPSRQKITVGGGQHKSTSTLLTYDCLMFV
jgi:hypothetical protein